jgi:Carboxypeptidase regulatory-like domain
MRKSLSIFILTLAISGYALAQSGAGLGSISGLVQDATGSSVPNAAVVVTDEAKGIRRNLETTSDGQFTAPALIPDEGYKVTVTKGGFRWPERGSAHIAERGVY